MCSLSLLLLPHLKYFQNNLEYFRSSEPKDENIPIHMHTQKIYKYTCVTFVKHTNLIQYSIHIPELSPCLLL